MSTKAFDKKTAAFIGFLIQNIPAGIDDAIMNGWMSNPDGMKKFLSGLKPSEMVPAKSTPLFSVIATTNLGEIAGKKTEKCFTGSRYEYRDNDFDNWLPKDQPKTDACAITTLAPLRNWSFAGATAAVLGTGTDITLLYKLLIGYGHTMTLAQAEEMVEATDRKEKTELRTDGYTNFFFVETGDEKDPVSVGYVLRDGRTWRAYVRRIDVGDRWGSDFRLLVRNLDTSKLK